MTSSRAAVVLFASEVAAERRGQTDSSSLYRFLLGLLAEARAPLSAARPAEHRYATRQALAQADFGREAQKLYQRGASEREQLVNSLDHTLSALRRAGATPNDLRDTGTERGRALGDALEIGDRALAALGRFDPGELPTAQDIAKANPRPGRSFEIWGLLQAEPAMLRTLLALHRSSLESGGAGLVWNLPRFDDPEHPVSRLGQLLERELASHPEPFELLWHEAPPRESTQVVCGVTPRAEARAIVARVRQALGSGTPPEQIAIAVPTQGPLSEAIVQTLSDARIPHTDGLGEPLLSRPEARGLLSLLDMTERGMSRDGLVEWLRLPGLHAGRVVLETEQRGAAQKAEAVSHVLSTLPLTWDKNGNGFIAATVATLGSDDWRSNAVASLVRDLSRVTSQTSLLGAAQALLKLANDTQLGRTPARDLREALDAEQAGVPNALWAMARGAEAVRLLTDEISAVAAVAERDLAPRSASDLRAELNCFADTARLKVRGTATRSGAVLLGSTRDLASAEFEHIFVGGLLARDLEPSRTASLLDDRTRDLLPPAARPPNWDTNRASQAALLAYALQAAPNVTLSYSQASDAGRETGEPHAELQRALLAFAPLHEEPASVLDPRASPASSREVALAALARGEPAVGSLGERLAIERKRAEFFLDSELAGDSHSGSIPALQRRMLLARLGGTTPESAARATLIDALARCPFAAFAEQVLRARRRRAIGETMDASERGTQTHEALLIAYSVYQTLPESMPRAEALDEVRRLTEERTKPPYPESGLRKAARGRTIASAVLLLEQELVSGRNQFLHGEVEFGPAHAPPWHPLELVGPKGNPLYFRGRIDRVDAQGDSAVVIDYKTGSAKPRLGETHFQLPIYAQAVQRGGFRQVDIAYVNVADGARGKQRQEQAVLPEWLSTATALLEDAYEGQFAPRPSSPAACSRCASRDLCRRPAVVPLEETP